ncbi:pyrroline-5-carboxylate reductase [Spizellomyces punctatus DAOM BR117]|uniref:Pyrroline-5-carboxylate reductase n=2 Tax=Spizellomyces punctatus (strain DAOM BR117) TaxID=645134 RepID=A0A0L0HQY8_SPIPD|nr:pyrroline-5-carboxylate reductase [Spizellomyces punctatus DAOM BR117]KND03254.1 pyrroline-5-carboxylate reductase [Spizellomyces punctatus DAOM BR117]|eukprot:XP_016611293.1 pyrroline-5-carboxylate reductase [Spizellomyces punctatus DAOM BR117]
MSAKLDTTKRITFIGGGNMANAIIGGLLANGYPPTNIIVSEPFEASREKLQSTFGVLTTTDNAAAVAFSQDPKNVTTPADLVMLAVKPQIMRDVAQGIAHAVQKHKPVVVTIAAGITLKDLAKWLSSDAQGNDISGARSPALVRVMPNTPALVLEGATGLFASSEVTEEQKTLAFNVLGAVSKSAFWVEREELLDVVTGLSGSGPAYFFLMVECLAAAATELGLPSEVAQGLARQTCLGAGRMLVDTAEDPAELRRKVTSPNGTTHAAIQSLEASGMRQAFKDAVVAATKRGEELGKMFSQPTVSGPKL